MPAPADAERAPAVMRLRLWPRPDFAILAAFVQAVEALLPITSVEIEDDGEGLVCRMEAEDVDAGWRALVLLPGPRLTGWRALAGGGWSVQLTPVPVEEPAAPPSDDDGAAPDPVAQKPDIPAEPAHPEAQGEPGFALINSAPEREAAPSSPRIMDADPERQSEPVVPLQVQPVHERHGRSLAALVREGQRRTRSFEDLLGRMRTQAAARTTGPRDGITDLWASAQEWRARLTPAQLRALQAGWIGLALLALGVVAVTLWAEGRSANKPAATPVHDASDPSHGSMATPLAVQTAANLTFTVTPAPIATATVEAASPTAAATVAATPTLAPTETATPAPPPTPTPAPAPPVLRHRVQPGETVFSIAQLYGVPMAAVLAANNLSGAASINAGQELIIPR